MMQYAQPGMDGQQQPPQMTYAPPGVDGQQQQQQAYPNLVAAPGGPVVQQDQA